MPAVHRLGDVNDGDGIIEDIAQGTVYANNLLVSIDGSRIEEHDLHTESYTANGSPTVFINGIPVNRQGDEDDCGHIRDGGSPDVFVDDGSGSNATGSSAPTQYNNMGGVGNGTPTPGSGNADGFKSISTTALTTVSANSIQSVMTALEKVGAIPAVERLPFGGDDASATPLATTMSIEPALTDVANISDTTLVTIEAWYTQKVFKTMENVGALPTENKLPFGGDDANG